jgi:NAD(P)-dependent dehydrogenase (short-subunit alcohol dehydrogenase family)
MADVAIILGVGPNLGQALARRFAAGGCDVAMLARDGDRLADLADDIAKETGRRIQGFSADGTDLDGLRAAMDRVMATMGPPTVFIHNVSRWIAAKAPELDPKVMMSELTLGPGAALAGAQAVLPAMEAAGRGTILWTGSRMALVPEEQGAAPALATAKVALRGLALAAAPAFHQRGINFGTITINGTIKEGTRFDPSKIAETFWQAHSAPRSEWKAERVFDGSD